MQNTIGFLLKEARNQRGLSRAKLSELCGITARAIQKIEEGGGATLSSLQKLMIALNARLTLSGGKLSILLLKS